MKLGAFLDNWAISSQRMRATKLAAYAVVSVALVVMAPFETQGDPWAWRFAYWFFMMCLFGFGIFPLTVRTAARLPAMRNLSFPLGAGIIFVSAAIPMTCAVLVFDIGFVALANRLPEVFGVEQSAGGPEDYAEALGQYPLVLYLKVLALSLLVGGLPFLSAGGFGTRSAEPAVLPKPGLKFLSRLPGHIGSDVCYLHMQDHYMRVATKGGEAMILMSMRDALAELEGVNGLQVHRSWWVATSEILRLARDGRKLVAVMSDGTQVPVSETYRAALEERTGLHRKPDRQS